MFMVLRYHRNVMALVWLVCAVCILQWLSWGHKSNSLGLIGTSRLWSSGEDQAPQALELIGETEKGKDRPC